MNQTKRGLTVPPNTTNGTPMTLILEQSAHCDWDWWNTFLGYYKHGFKLHGQDHQPVETTLNEAIALMTKYSSQTTSYIYAFCEMAYLRHYLKENPGQVSVIKGLAQFLSLSSGGITSADNLLSHGETFIRNYLLGRHWAITELGITPTNQMWIPDDFGHDAQLPIVLQAMGFMGAGFWRIGGNEPGVTTPSAEAPSSILSSTIGLDFIWQAKDHSSVQAHWLSNSYCEGNGIPYSQGPGGSTITWGPEAQDAINTIVGANLNEAPLQQPTPFLFAPVDCDFCTPYTNLPDIVTSWTSSNQPNGTEPEFPGYVAQMGTFDSFMQQVQSYTAPGNENGAKLPVCYSNPPPGVTPQPPLFVPNPFFAGCYGSRPQLKFLHYQTTRILLMAEAMEIFLEYLAFMNATKWDQIAAEARSVLAKAWLHLVPSTHHDYITGTAPDRVYKKPPPKGEQLYDLQVSLKAAEKIQRGVLRKIAGAVPCDPTLGVTVAVFNSLGFARSDLVEIPAPEQGLQSSSISGSDDSFPVQYVQSVSGVPPTMLFMGGDPSSGAGIPSLGYASVYLSDQAPTVTPKLSLEASTAAPGSYVLGNESLSAVISPDGIQELYDLVNDPSQQNNLLGDGGSQIVFYNDSGNIYRFGNELPPSNSYPPSTFYLDGNVSLDSHSLTIIEQGPLRCTVRATGTVLFEQRKLEFVTEYSLVAGEPFVRMTTTGTAPGTRALNSTGYSVMVKFPFASTIAALTYGTAYHWDTREPRNYIGWPTSRVKDVEAMTFEPTHEFVIPVADDSSYLGAIYHSSTPGWAIDSSGALLGCILRNTPGTQQAAWGTDMDEHTVSYALRLPGTSIPLTSPASGCNPGGPLGEALRYNNPLIGQVVPTRSSLELPATMSIAATKDPTAVIIAAKAGTMNETDLILRVYQPTNESLPRVQINLDSQLAQMYGNGTLNVTGQTALETPIDSENLSLAPSETSFTFTAPFAITTLTLSRG